MLVKREIIAGTEDKSDARLIVGPAEHGRQIVLEKLPHPRFREADMAVIGRVLDEEGAEDVSVRLWDFGALDFVIEARLRAALHEAGKGDD